MIRVYRIGSLSIIIVEFAIVYQFYHTHTWFDSTINNRSLNDSSVQAEGSYDDEEISPRKPPKKDFFKSLLCDTRQEKSEAELYLENPSKSKKQFESYPTIMKIYE